MKLFRKLVIVFIAFLIYGCAPDKSGLDSVGFRLLDSEKTGIDFSNNLEARLELNVFTYMYFYNGGGLGAGDFNNDGKIDLFFTSNMGEPALYLNRGDMRFEDVTEQSGIRRLDEGWTNGVAVVDIDQDGKLDLYVSQVGDYKTIKGQNQLFICKEINSEGIPVYEEKASEFGLDLVGFSTQSAFFDYDLDGDLDMFQLNHSLHQNGTFGQRKVFAGTLHPLSGDKLLKNENGRFVDVTAESGIYSSVIGYGLGVAVGDINLDGWPDMYIGNDFHENDYLYINQQDGSFKEVSTEQMMHTSRFSMGVDIGDINNDGYQEIISLDMLPEDPYILKKSEGEDSYGIFDFKLGYGYSYQYAKNNLQINNGNGTFSEVAMYSGIHATDWSWAPLFLDFDNDGLKDLFISNGIPKRMNDIDYINFIANDDVQWKIRTGNMEEGDLSLLDKLPEIKLPNKFYRNAGQFDFTDLEKNIAGNKESYSNGSVFADLDNDGDLDIVVNNIEDKAFIYENTSLANRNSSLAIALKGSEKNKNAIGSKAIVYKDDQVIIQEKYPTRGFQSSMEIPMLLGLGDYASVDSILLIWPDNTYEKIGTADSLSEITLQYKPGLPAFDYSLVKKNTGGKSVIDITDQTGIKAFHEENPFVEFNREPLIPHMTSSDGPALAIGDINNDGLEDLFLGSSKRRKSQLFFQREGGKFERSEQAVFHQDSTYEEVDAVFTDLNNDGSPDLAVATGGNEYYYQDKFLFPRVYLNDGLGNFTPKEDAFDSLYITASCILPYDFSGDGHTDLFLGGRAVSWAYGEIPQSYLLENDGTGKFKDVTSAYSPELSLAGLVKNGVWHDIDADGDKDLLLALEWGGVHAYLNNGDSFEKTVVAVEKGWWNFLLPADFDNDGDVDLIAGNTGMNNRLRPTKDLPVRMYYNDFDDNGKKEQVLTYYVKGKEVAFANKMELQTQIPTLKKRFIFAEDFARASIEEIFSKEKLKNSSVLEANYFYNAVLVNNGNMEFETRALPYQLQLSPYKDAVIFDANGDDLPDVFIAGNYYGNNVQMGRYDCDFGTVLINKGNCDFSPSPLNGIQVKGQVRRIEPININGTEAFGVARNFDSLMVLQFVQ